MKLKQNRKGFTLIELMISIVIIGIIGVGITTYFVRVFDTWFTVRNASQSIINAQNALDEMSRTIRQATPGEVSVDVDASSNTVTFKWLNNSVWEDRTYTQINNTLQRTDHAGINSLLIREGLNSITFHHLSKPTIKDPDKILITIDMSVGQGHNRQDIRLSRTVFLRNP